MAMLGKTICYINSSCIALMWWVKTLKHKIQKRLSRKTTLFTEFCKIVIFVLKNYIQISSSSFRMVTSGKQNLHVI